MANIKSAKKRSVQAEKHRVRNQARRSEFKTVIKKFFDALDANDLTAAKEFARLAESKVARACGKGLVKKNAASRKISRMAKNLNKKLAPVKA